MRKTAQFFILCIVISLHVYAQSDRFSQLNTNNLEGYGKPLVTTLGTGINSAGFYTAAVPKTFGFSISLRAMLITIPNDQLTFTPTLPNGYTASPSPTFWGSKSGNAYEGKNGYVVMPGGINQKSIPFAMPQLTGSFMGTELLLRVLPSVNVNDNKFSFFGAALKHSISQYIPLIPVDLAVQVMYNTVKFGSFVKGSNIALNGEASKEFGLFTAYGGLQYESSSFDFSYELKGDPNSGDPGLRQNRNISSSIKGANNFRVILGGALKMAVVVINADVNIGSQTAFTSGLSFEF